MEFSIDSFFSCDFSFGIISSMTSLLDLRLDFLGFSGRHSTSSTSWLDCNFNKDSSSSCSFSS
jgi:hypothetical protein